MAKKMKTAAIKPPKTQAEAETMLAEIGHMQRQAANTKMRLDAKIATVSERHLAEITEFENKAAELFDALFAWASTNRDEICPAGRKHARLSTGELRWRMTPPKVGIRGQDDVIERLKANDLADCVRTKEEVNKEAILANPGAVDHIKGITITQTEEFVAVPTESNVELQTVSKKLSGADSVKAAA